ncbi:hypothetical protein AYR62_13810 [Secundilactobacillus paracollinoides]|uniref:Uncharacterized protein n=1 Tax=Secundilactobacillus paracollinoides TaxID=240427 RepID=A0A1B2IWS2_9LACO|nr:hypothetical protein [Secundilactobacillus paracollinoides]ANZ60673.1 hypothetical protein AYR61_04505 [Secundilactobacillus paracollinoides]ANZ65045.1 hypothetical protein AYR62_13810 [Secundilactobacillus paracollinoides]ANZ66516.1 hypothetical protein AYR63_04790 [Secundilactobacillus paracollinoides]
MIKGIRLALALGIFGTGMYTTTTQANAATWHSGTPASLHSGFWKASYEKYTYAQFTKSHIYLVMSDTATFTHPFYRHISHGYVIRMKDATAGTPMNPTGVKYRYLRVITSSKSKIKVSWSYSYSRYIKGHFKYTAYHREQHDKWFSPAKS